MSEMFFLLSGEGTTDLGAGTSDAGVSVGKHYTVGPLTIMVDQIVEERHGYSMLESGSCGYVSERQLSNRASELKTAKKSLGLPGKKRAKETRGADHRNGVSFDQHDGSAVGGFQGTT